MTPTQRRWIVGLLSFFFWGLGQAAQGRLQRALQWPMVSCLAWFVGIQAMAFLPPSKDWLVLYSMAVLVVPLLSAYDAARLPPTAPLQWKPVVKLLVVTLCLCGTTVGWFHIALDCHIAAGSLFSIPSLSMIPTLQVGDKIAVDLWKKTPRRGDVVVFLAPDENEGHVNLVKRVVGLAGDRVKIQNGKLWITGEQQNEPFDAAEADFPETLVPNGTMFVLGDNRNNSQDSRYYGPVSVKKMVGRATWIYMSKDVKRIGTAL